MGSGTRVRIESSLKPTVICWQTPKFDPTEPPIMVVICFCGRVLLVVVIIVVCVVGEKKELLSVSYNAKISAAVIISVY